MSTQQILNPVILPVIRRVMPQIIANQLIGVQPMTDVGPDRFSTKLNKEHFKHFLRVNNRKKNHNMSSIAKLGYPLLKIRINDIVSSRNWCRAHLKSGSFIFVSSYFCFSSEKDAFLFMLRWDAVCEKP